MASSWKQTAKAEDVIESDYDELSVMDDDANDIGSPFSSSKKISKVSEALDLLRQKTEIIQELADNVLEKVKADGAPGLTEATGENIRRILEQLTFNGLMKGKSTLGGIGKDLKEHKVRPVSARV